MAGTKRHWPSEGPAQSRVRAATRGRPLAPANDNARPRDRYGLRLPALACAVLLAAMLAALL